MVDASSARKGPVFWLLVTLVAALVLYPLSYGPWLWYSTWVAEEDNLCVDAFFAPLLSFAEHGPTWGAKAYAAYLQWWILLGDR